MSEMSRTEETRSNLLEAFWELYREKPISKITVKEITDKAGYNRGTFYTYFADVYEVLEILKASLMPDEEMIIDPLIELKDNEGKIIEPIQGTNDYLLKNGEKIAVLLGPKGDPSFVHELKARLRNIMLSYAEELEIKEIKSFEYVVEYHIAGLISMYQLWIENSENIDEDSLGLIYEKTAYEGALTVVNHMLNNTK